MRRKLEIKKTKLEIKENCKNVKTKSTNYMTYMSVAFGSTFPNIKIKKTASSEIKRIIGSLKSSKTQGYDENSNHILKACKIFISVPLSYLCNLALFEGIFLERLKYTTIVPVYKKVDKSIVTNCRPISILTSFNKIFEKVMYCRLLKHLSDNNIISNHQFGFRVN
jgi:Notch-like protein